MKRILLLATLLLFVLGCNRSQSSPPKFHVLSADTCDRPTVVGTIGNKEYALDVENAPLYIACPGPVKFGDIGKDFAVTVNLDLGEMTLDLPSGKAKLMIVHMREVK